ncbi:MAG: hypothetical protein P8182_16280, partial [Deltaproteobacteria bacterium]
IVNSRDTFESHYTPRPAVIPSHLRSRGGLPCPRPSYTSYEVLRSSMLFRLDIKAFFKISLS